MTSTALRWPHWTLAMTLMACGIPCLPTAHAEIIDFTIALTGAEQVPPIDTAGTGDVSIQLDTLTGEILIGGSFDLLMGAATTAALVGFAPPGALGDINLINLAIIPLDDARTAGDVSGSGTLTQEQVQNLLAQLTYINIRSEAFPEGELRGQVVPAPATIALTSGLLAARRRRR